MKYVDFVRENRPTTTINIDSVRDVCNKNNIGIGFYEGGVRLSVGSVYIVTRLEISWGNIIENRKLVFIPRMHGSEYTIDSENLARVILDSLGITKVEIDLPEQVIILPVPSWVGVISDDYYWGYSCQPMFVSEAKLAIEELNAQFKQIVGKQNE